MTPIAQTCDKWVVYPIILSHELEKPTIFGQKIARVVQQLHLRTQFAWGLYATTVFIIFIFRGGAIRLCFWVIV